MLGRSLLSRFCLIDQPSSEEGTKDADCLRERGYEIQYRGQQKRFAWFGSLPPASSISTHRKFKLWRAVTAGPQPLDTELSITALSPSNWSV